MSASNNLDKSLAYNWVTKKFNHPRPFVELGDLNGTEGNAFIVTGKSSSALKRAGYMHEMAELQFLIYNYTQNYETSFDKISFFLNLSPMVINPVDMLTFSVPVEENGEIVFRVKKDEYLKAQEAFDLTMEGLDTTQIFSNSYIKKLINKCATPDGVNKLKDTLNNLGRNIAHYCSINDIKVMCDYMSTSDLAELFNHKDESGMGAVNHILFAYGNKSNNDSTEIYNAILKMCYCVMYFGDELDYKQKDIFDRDFSLQWKHINSKIDKSYGLNQAETIAKYKCLLLLQKCADLVNVHLKKQKIKPIEIEMQKMEKDSNLQVASAEMEKDLLMISLGKNTKTDKKASVNKI